jgi:hypothetical protein
MKKWIKMGDFEMFQQYHKDAGSEDVQDNETITKENCLHNNIIVEHNTHICTECGRHFNPDVSYDKEWRYYGMMDTKHTSDPNRCYKRKSDERTIHKDVEKMGFGDKIVSMANRLYDDVTHGKIYRGNSRKGIIFACIFHSYKMSGNPQSCEHLLEVFQIDRKVGLRGLKYVNINAPKNSLFRQYKIQSENIIEEILNKFNASDQQKKEVFNIYNQVKDRSSILNRSRPQSVACGVIRYYILKKNNTMSMDYFRNKVKLSELTINRIVHEIENILG